MDHPMQSQRSECAENDWGNGANVSTTAINAQKVLTQRCDDHPQQISKPGKMSMPSRLVQP